MTSVFGGEHVTVVVFRTYAFIENAPRAGDRDPSLNFRRRHEETNRNREIRLIPFGLHDCFHACTCAHRLFREALAFRNGFTLLGDDWNPKRNRYDFRNVSRVLATQKRSGPYVRAHGLRGCAEFLVAHFFFRLFLAAFSLFSRRPPRDHGHDAAASSVFHCDNNASAYFGITVKTGPRGKRLKGLTGRPAVSNVGDGAEFLSAFRTVVRGRAARGER